jgi:hypothetical protein
MTLKVFKKRCGGYLIYSPQPRHSARGLVASPFKPAIDVIEDLVTNWLINRGLIVIDIGAVMIEGKVDQALLDNALDLAFEKLKVGRDKITPQEGSKIDAETTQAFDQFADIHSTNPDNDGVPNVSSTPFELGYIKPYSGDCHFKNVVTKTVRDVPKNECDTRRLLLIPIDSARVVLDDLQINCHLQQCTEIRGAGDSILLTIDQGLQKIPW